MTDQTLTIGDNEEIVITVRHVSEAPQDPTPDPEPTPEPTPDPSAGTESGTSPVLQDFGDVDATDADVLEAALQWSMDNGVRVRARGEKLTINRGVVVASIKNVTQTWGISGPLLVRSTIADNSDVITIRNNHSNRFLQIDGLMIQGNGTTGKGLVLDGESGFWSNMTISNLVVQNCEYGVWVEGMIFESSLVSPRLFDIRKNGINLKNRTGSKVISSFRIHDPNIAQVGGIGIRTDGPDNNSHGAPQDVIVSGGYIRNCGRWAVFFRLGGNLSNMLFENNMTSLEMGDPEGSHIFTTGVFRGHALEGRVNPADSSGTGATYLGRSGGSGNHDARWRDCNHIGSGAKMLRLENTAFAVIDECPGTVDGNGGGWVRYARGVRTTRALVK